MKDSDQGSKVYLEGYEFDLPFRWLATMIVRVSADMNGLLENILATKYLGDIDEKALAHFEEHCPEIDPTAQACEPNLPNQFGFWLPRGIRTATVEEMADDVLACIVVFDRIEECYQEWFGLAPGDLLTE